MNAEPRPRAETENKPCAGDAAADDGARLLAMINANWMTQAIGAFATLGLPAQLAGGPQDGAALAAATASDLRALERLLRAAATLGLCRLLDDGRFELTPRGALLDPTAAGSLHHWARLRTARWNAWDDLASTVRTGAGPRKRATGRDDFAYLDADAHAAGIFNAAMRDLTRRVAAGVLQQVHFRGDETLVDVGGGSGELLVAIAAAHPAMRGVVFDLAHARTSAEQAFDGAGLGERCRFVAGSFFEPWPVRGDVFLLKSVLHNWDDERARTILASCRQAMAAGSRLLVVERLAPERWLDCDEHRAVAASDLNMLVGLSGRERSGAQLSALLGHSGLTVTRTVAAALGFSVVEAAIALR